jgi:NADH-quinone oxidoreductase subunit F
MQEHRRLLPPDARPVDSLHNYEASGGLAALRHVRHSQPAAIVDEITRAGLRGRGGAGFPTGTKWASIINGPEGTRYAACNGAEGEPGTFKDRYLLRLNPYQVIEGLAIAARTVDAARVFMCVKRSFTPEIDRLRAAVEEFYASGILGTPPTLTVELVLGPDEYLFGEEKALLEVIEGNLPLPRVLPPYMEGLFRQPPAANPTLVNNVETLANVPHILRHGAEWFRRVGTTSAPGTMIFTLCGDAQRPGCYELPLGTPLRVLVEGLGGGPPPGRTLKAIFPGASNAILTADELDAPMDFDGLRAVGSGLGSAGFIVYDDSTCLVSAAALYSRFLYVESCGQCPPCKYGSGEITTYLDRLARGEGSRFDVETALARCAIVDEGNRCALPVGERLLINSLLRRFATEFEAHFGAPCPLPRRLVLPKIVDFDLQQGFTYDEKQHRKQPDWTFEEEGTAREDTR